MRITAETKVCMVIGDPIKHSLSPQIHNAGYEALGIDNDFVYVACKVGIENIATFIEGSRTMQIRGVSCTMPHKIEVMRYLDEVDEVAKKIGAVNTVVNENGILKGYNTDWIGVVTPLERVTSLANKTVALIGAGGAARAVAYGVTQRGAEVTIYNRTVENAQALAEEFGGNARSLSEVEEIKNMDIVFNAIPVGPHHNENESLLSKELITDRHIVFDVVYAPPETKLLKDAKHQGARVIYGMEMLLQQTIAQFTLYTRRDAPEEAMRDVLLHHLEIHRD